MLYCVRGIWYGSLVCLRLYNLKHALIEQTVISLPTTLLQISLLMQTRTVRHRGILPEARSRTGTTTYRSVRVEERLWWSLAPVSALLPRTDRRIYSQDEDMHFYGWMRTKALGLLPWITALLSQRTWTAGGR